MRKRIISAVISALMCASLCACGNEDVNKATNENGQTVVNIENPTYETWVYTDEPTQELTNSRSWIEENGIQTANIDSSVFTTQMLSPDLCANLGEVRIPYTIELSESTDGVEPGYKKVIAKYCEDCTPSHDTIIADWISAFDAYTGYTFETRGDTIMTEGGETLHREGKVEINYNNTTYNVSMTKDIDNQWPKVYYTVTVICPENYDGVVFQVGGSNAQLDAAQEAIDFGSKLYRVDELPHWGEGYSYYRMQ